MSLRSPSVLRRIGHAGLGGLADALAAGRIRPPYAAADVARAVPEGLADEVAAEMNRRHAAGLAPEHLAWALRLLREEVEATRDAMDRVEIVWTGPRATGTGVRDTAVVVRGLVAEARQTVLVASYVSDEGPKGRHIWEPLAARMDAVPGLVARLFLNVRRTWKDERSDAVLLREFADRFRLAWPGGRVPEVFYDPRAIALAEKQRPVLHAKVVIVDDARALITSANFTEAAHERNIEAGTLVDDPRLARALSDQFDGLVTSGALGRVPGL